MEEREWGRLWQRGSIGSWPPGGNAILSAPSICWAERAGRTSPSLSPLIAPFILFIRSLHNLTVFVSFFLLFFCSLFLSFSLVFFGFLLFSSFLYLSFLFLPVTYIRSTSQPLQYVLLVI